MIPVRSAMSRAARAVAVALLVGGGVAVVTPAAGAQTPSLSVSSTVLPVGQASTVTVMGSGYLVPPHAADRNVFGGVYVLFGWVAPGTSWGPSSRNGTNSNGQYGITYSYAGVSRGADTRDDGTGHNRFVSFTTGGVSGESTDFHMTMDPAFADNSRGNWATTITVASHLYQWVDPATGASATVDCTKVQCGIYTIGAHGVASATNERFTPITFSNGAPAPAPAPVVTPAPSPTASAPSSGGSTAPSGGGSATVGGAAAGRAPTTKVPTTKAPTTVAGAPVTSAPAGPPAASETSIAPEETSAAIDPGVTTTTPLSSATTTTTDGGRDDATAAPGRVIVLDSGDGSDGLGAAGWALAIGAPVSALAGGLWWRRRSTLVSGS